VKDIQPQFSEEECEQLTLASVGNTICPAGYYIDPHWTGKKLAEKLRQALSTRAQERLSREWG
jgi:hypothetical protein